jgi:hypothetical protein
MPPIDGNIDLQTLIFLLSQMGSEVNPTLMDSAYPNNVSASGVKSSFSPEILLASGLVSPETLNELTASELMNLQSKYASSIQSQLPPEATDIALYPITSKYMGSDEFSDFMRSTLDAIGSGKVTPAQALEKIQTDADVPSVVIDNLGQVSDDIDKFVELVGRRDFARAKFDYEQQGKVGAAGPAPTAESARLALFNKLGVPQLALLGDPNATYQFDPSMFVDKGRIASYEDAMRMPNKILTAAGTAGPAMQMGKLEQSYAGRALQEQARKYAENAVKDMKTNSAWTEDLGSIAGSTGGGAVVGGIAGATPTMGIGAPFGALVGGASGLVGGLVDWATGRNDKKYEKAKEDARKAAYEKELARLKASLPSTSVESTRVKYDPEYAAARGRVNTIKSELDKENAYGKAVASALEKELVARGLTPFKQNINQLLGYAIQTAKK